MASVGGHLFAPYRLGVRGAVARITATQHSDEIFDHSDKKDEAAESHTELWNPQRRGIVALRDIVELEGLPHQSRGEPGQEAGQQRAGEMRPDIQHAVRGLAKTIEEKRDTDMLAALEGMRQREEGCRRHAVAGVGVGAAHMKIEQAAAYGQQDHYQRADHEQRRQPGGGTVKRVEGALHFISCRRR